LDLFITLLRSALQELKVDMKTAGTEFRCHGADVLEEYQKHCGGGSRMEI
jgi:hypothetical protein